jgi:glutathione synthase/RimK-type ligase-like ATP-grasp enzyme
MKRVLIVGRRNSGEKNDIKLLTKELSKYESETFLTEFSFFEDIIVSIDHQHIQYKFLVKDEWRELSDFRLLIFMGWSHDKLYSDLAGSLARQAKSQQIPVWNSELVEARSMTKLSQLTRVGALGLSLPKTTFSLSTQHQLSVQDKFLEMPIIAKDPTASRGRRNYLISSKEELARTLQDNPPLLLQEYINNDSSDLRVVIAGGKPVFAIRRKAGEGTHLNNISAGGSAHIIDLKKFPKSLINDSVTIADEFKRELCGIDFIFNVSNGQHVFLEINLTPQLVNGVFMDEKMQAISIAIKESMKG